MTKCQCTAVFITELTVPSTVQEPMSGTEVGYTM